MLILGAQLATSHVLRVHRHSQVMQRDQLIKCPLTINRASELEERFVMTSRRTVAQPHNTESDDQDGMRTSLPAELCAFFLGGAVSSLQESLSSHSFYRLRD